MFLFRMNIHIDHPMCRMMSHLFFHLCVKYNTSSRSFRADILHSANRLCDSLAWSVGKIDESSESSDVTAAAAAAAATVGDR